MIPKIIHLCWFGNAPYPVEIKRCIASWKRILPDYTIRRWTYDDARAIGCRFVNEALAARKWAFAADVVRFYAVYTEGGLYMDSDVLLKRRFDEYVPEHGFTTFIEKTSGNIAIQAAFFMGEKGNVFCKEMIDYYMSRSFKGDNGELDLLVSPKVMVKIAEPMGYVNEDREQRLECGLTIYPSYMVLSSSSKRTCDQDPRAFAVHTIYGSWRHRKLGRRVELWLKHLAACLDYYVFNRLTKSETNASKSL